MSHPLPSGLILISCAPVVIFSFPMALASALTRLLKPPFAEKTFFVALRSRSVFGIFAFAMLPLMKEP